MNKKYITEGETTEQLCINFLNQLDPLLNEVMPMGVTYTDEKELYSLRIYILREAAKAVINDLKVLHYEKVELEKAYNNEKQ